MKRVPVLPDGHYPFREDVYPLQELAMSEAPPELADFLIGQAKANGLQLIRDEVVELVCRGEGMEANRFTIYWPAGSGIHVLVPKKHAVGRA